MLARIIEAHGGTLPPDVIPVFCNTGLEHESTYLFLREIGERMAPIVWLEYVYDEGAKTKHSFKVVDFCTASRNGEPFSMVIAARKYLPNPVTRFCTAELKIRTGNRYAASLGWNDFVRAVGLRYDEPRRVAKLKGEGGEEVACPISAAKETLSDVLAFWKSQPFDLQLPANDNSFGNCNLCFLKSRSKIEKVMMSRPDLAAWWIEQEERFGKTFRIDRPSYKQMLTQVTVQGRMFNDHIEDDTTPCHCTD